MENKYLPRTTTKTKECTKWDDELCKYDPRYRKKYNWKNFVYDGCWCCHFWRKRELMRKMKWCDLLDIPKQIRNRYKIKFDRKVHGAKLTRIPV